MRAKKRLLFLDGICPQPYDPEVLAKRGLGGTEGTVIRIAEGLAGLGGVEVTVAQHCRTDAAAFQAKYVGPSGTWSLTPWDAVIVLRNPQHLPDAKNVWPQARFFLWLHDLPTQFLHSCGSILEVLKPTVITVSEFHRQVIFEALRAAVPHAPPHVVFIHNPIDDDLAPDDAGFSQDKLIFPSSPHKGLAHALRCFARALEFHPHFQLLVANPGYVDIQKVTRPNVTFLGSLPHKELLKVVRESLCVFYPNTTFPETFGLVYAEANAVGTPVLTHDLGAAREVLGPGDQVLDCSDPKNVVDRLLVWYAGGRPQVRANPQFRLHNILRQWRTLLDLDGCS